MNATFQAIDWHGAKWIGMPESWRGRSAPLLRREFALDAAVREARLILCGLGCHEAEFNGQRVGDHVLDPAQTDYEQRCFVVTHDVTALLRPGVNALGVMLGDGWFNQDVVWTKDFSYGPPRLLAVLTVEFIDGARFILITDESWRSARGPVVASNLYAGETYDARQEWPGWSQPGFDDAKWLPCVEVAAPGGRLEEQPLPPMRRIEEIRPVAITEPQPGYWVIDFGQNFSGWVRLTGRAAAGTAVRLRFAEELGPGGMVDTASTGFQHTRVEQIDTYLYRGAAIETWEPRFTYHGFRYVEVTGWPGKLEREAFTGVVVHTDLAVAGTFACSEERLNRLHRMALWTHRSNCHGLPEDCPVRERCGWLGDAHIICDFSLFNFHGDTFWRKYLDDIETARARNGGLPTMVAPGRRDCGTASPDWMAALVLIVWTHYLFHGQRDVAAAHWDGMRAVMDHFQRLSENWLLPHGLGDWFDPGERAQPSYTPVVKTSTLLFGQCAEAMGRLARALNHPDETAVYAGWNDQIRTAFRQAFYDPEMHSFGSQTANAMALELGFVPLSEQQAVADSLAADVREHGHHSTVGIMGMKYLFPALTRRGHGAEALAVLRQDSYPSFGDLIRRGATTLWESWGEAEVDARHGTRSRNHPMMGGFDGFFFDTLAGIRPDPERPGFERVIIEPHPIPGIDWVRAYYNSPHGRIVSDWTTTSGKFEWRGSTPPGVEADIRLPKSAETEPSGE